MINNFLKIVLTTLFILVISTLTISKAAYWGTGDFGGGRGYVGAQGKTGDSDGGRRGVCGLPDNTGNENNDRKYLTIERHCEKKYSDDLKNKKKCIKDCLENN